MSVPPRSLHFYFDYLSPFAFFAWRKIEEFCRQYDAALNVHPVVFGKLLDHWGQRGPAEIPPKTAWVARYCQRYASHAGFDYNPPKYHPFNPLPALRLSLQQVSGDKQCDVITALFNGGWTEGADLGDVDSLLQILDRAGVDTTGFAALIAEPAVNQALVDETSTAISRGVFGVPTMIVDDELFWGNDQFEHIALLLEGKDTIDREKLKQFATRPRKIDRKAIT